MNFECICEAQIMSYLSLHYNIVPKRIDRLLGYSVTNDLNVINIETLTVSITPDRKDIKSPIVIYGDLRDTFYIGEFNLVLYHTKKPVNDYGMWMGFNNILSFDIPGNSYSTSNVYLFRYDSNEGAGSVGGVWPAKDQNDVIYFNPFKNTTFFVGPIIQASVISGAAGSLLNIHLHTWFNGFRFYLR